MHLSGMVLSRKDEVGSGEADQESRPAIAPEKTAFLLDEMANPLAFKPRPPRAVMVTFTSLQYPKRKMAT